MSDVLDFRLNDLVPADADSKYAQRGFCSDDLTILAEHHTAPNGSHSYVVAHDRSITRGVPGEPQIAAITVARDCNLHTYTLQTAYHATAPFAQNWLIERGCPPERIAQIGDDCMQPADDLTVQIEQHNRESGTRYEVLSSRTSDLVPCEAWTMTRDCLTGQAPVRVFPQEGDFDAHTYTVREGAFFDERAAGRCLDERGGPMPQPPEYRGQAIEHRARAALIRSSGASAIPKAGLDAPSAPPTGTAQRPSRGRSL
ncbi:glycosyl hydrolase [Streptomyces zagrosensis]|uniref:Glycosyl hydrolase n=1 Tax=Streptomyces zagrosensis TaxID=1042984 RepID=A0A7W9QGQ4_9ACTN|nr:glycosyl hydrolase [Streptomyces zagrosensis]MBB5939970.1 hypothetical protein [Streptomyces zagrosensis]